MASTVRDLIKGSLRLIGVLATGETPSAEELNDALSVLNDMLGSWSLESLTLFSQQRESFPLVPGKRSYTMGDSGDFDTVRPLSVQMAGVEIIGTELPIQISNQSQWAHLSIKSTPGLPSQIYIDYSHPRATIDVWPVPSVANNLILYSAKSLTSFSSINDPLTLPPGYAKALRYNLATELAPEYGRSLDAAIIAGAVEGKENIKRMNIKPQYLDSDFVSSRPFNWLTGE